MISLYIDFTLAEQSNSTDPFQNANITLHLQIPKSTALTQQQVEGIVARGIQEIKKHLGPQP